MQKKENRNVKKSFRFTHDEWLKVEYKCQIANLTPSQYFQQIAVRGKTAKNNCLKEKQLYMGQIAIIANNINLIARELNSDKKVDLWMLKLLLKIEQYLTERLLL